MIMDAIASLPADGTQQPAERSRRISGIQRGALTLLVIGGALNYVDRATLSIGNVLIRQELGLSLADMGLLLSAFLWAYAFAQLPAGVLVDRLGPRWLLTAAIVIWSCAQAAAGLVTGFGQFVVTRVVLGLGEAPQFPTAARVVRDWFGPRDRGTATGIWNTSSMLGNAISAPLLTFLMLWFGWRWMFAIMGLAGLVVAAVWYWLYRDPGAVALTTAENRYRTEGDTTGEGKPVTMSEWRRLFACRTTWGMIMGFFGAIYITWVFTAWLPGYLELQRHMSIKATGWATAVPFVAGIFGSLFGGWLCDRLMLRHGLSPLNSRKYPMAAALTGMALCTVAAALVESNLLAIVFISGAMFLGYVSTSSAWAMASVAAPTNCTASLGSMQNFGGYLGGALAPMITGFIVQGTGSFVPALLFSAAVGLICAVGYVLIIRQPITAAELEA
jgi:sugar phosphate permease